MTLSKSALTIFSLVLFLVAAPAFAQDHQHSTTGMNGYDPVAYFTDGKPKIGNGHHLAMFEGVTYLFASKANQETFKANPEKYAPAFGGYCAYGVAVGKKFVGDPQVWKIVKGKLYLNLDKNIQSTWNEDIPGYISKADANWMEIRDKAPSDL